ncbi:DoxX family protein [Bordetella avium]|uniref:Membrane protein n=1 Tax=Bordetella avium (strain 197N) TaxID=360910 RepID=Q2L0U4_BORA1|nr:DoxX family protein [Bordetella avium]AZY49173.1 DoxX family protein [Bordetella avium]AZY52529.1 DoxX family protein [Bordetella avium]RIQ12321.1 DoxX family protein [Bordetella avium]RIQ19306.1 DoxX family protein [Bordetella avium]RIQ33474.1 DoxX family protein [Bordetella avium]
MIRSDDTGKLVLRLALGIMILLHGLAKLSTGVGPIVEMISSRGLPGFLAYGVYVGEIIAPLLLILGLYTRVGAFIIFVNMVVALMLVHSGQFGSINPKTGGWSLELQGMFLFSALALFFTGAGRFSLGGAGGRWN